MDPNATYPAHYPEAPFLLIVKLVIGLASLLTVYLMIDFIYHLYESYQAGIREKENMVAEMEMIEAETERPFLSDQDRSFSA